METNCEGDTMKMYRSPQYRKVLAFLLRAGAPVFTKQVLATLGVPPNPLDAEYSRGYGVVCRLIARGWVIATPAPAGHVNLLSLTEEGLDAARRLEQEVQNLVLIYAGTSTGAIEVPVNQHLPQQPELHAISSSLPQATSLPILQDYITCDICREQMPIYRAREIYKKYNDIECTCGNKLTRNYLDVAEAASFE